MAGVVARWREAQAASDQLWQVVKPQAMTRRPVPERHRLVFYLGHLEAFDWNLLAPALEQRPFRAEWDKLFAFGIDPVDGQLPSDPAEAWPAVAEIGAYNRRVRQQLGDALARQGGEAIAQRLEVAIEHRWMHVETLSYLFHNLDYADKVPGPAPAPGRAAPPAAALAPIPAGRATLGKRRQEGFGWDNEFEAHEVEVPAFGAARRKVSNGEYMEFVAAGAAAPHFWVRRGSAWYYRGMFAEVPLPLDQPVYVTHAEATAYAAWRGQRLPSEAEWHRMAYATPAGEEHLYPWGATPPASAAGNFDLRNWDPVSTLAPETASAWGIEDLMGNGWEWTATPFGPFPGFEPFPFYPGYSANFFDNQHFVMKGGSARTAACLLRRSFRNWFQPNYPYVYAGFRCVA